MAEDDGADNRTTTERITVYFTRYSEDRVSWQPVPAEVIRVNKYGAMEIRSDYLVGTRSIHSDAIEECVTTDYRVALSRMIEIFDQRIARLEQKKTAFRQLLDHPSLSESQLKEKVAKECGHLKVLEIVRRWRADRTRLESGQNSKR